MKSAEAFASLFIFRQKRELSIRAVARQCIRKALRCTVSLIPCCVVGDAQTCKKRYYILGKFSEILESSNIYISVGIHLLL